ncbi:MAG TPA: polyprenol monophosphomannose synthase [Bdellovibrionota bacterium]|jgi:dolichol-phosphate mannosyltransferase|nr:polyprenol monophosphomannose synthase [Bdellovibrionota bacterium]
MSDKKLLICIPTYNERENVPLLVEEIFKVLPAGAQVLFIDDNSPDGTGALIEDLAKANPKIHGLHRKGKLGLASAYVAGFEWGLREGYEWVMEMDADFSHDPEHLRDFMRLIGEGKATAIVGSRYIEGGGVSNWSPSRVLLSRMGSIYARTWLRHSVSDFTGGFNAWHRDLLAKMNLGDIQSKGYAFQIELKYRALEIGGRLVETPIVFRERRFGASKMSGDIVREAVIGVIKLRLRREQDQLFDPSAGNGS